MKQLLSILSAGMLLGLAGCATTGAQDPQSGEQLGDVPTTAETTYVTVTGSRIRHRTGADGRVDLHSAFPVVVFSREDLDRTGKPEPGAALKILHPALY